MDAAIIWLFSIIKTVTTTWSSHGMISDRMVADFRPANVFRWTKGEHHLLNGLIKIWPKKRVEELGQTTYVRWSNAMNYLLAIGHQVSGCTLALRKHRDFCARATEHATGSPVFRSTLSTRSVYSVSALDTPNWLSRPRRICSNRIH